MLNLNIGSGQRRFEGHGWVNVDCVSRIGQVPDLVCNILTEPLPFTFVDTVALVHVLEHWTLPDAMAALRECYRVLTVGGSLIVIVPNIRELATAWLQGRIDDYIYTVNMMGAYQGEIGDIHKWHWTPTGLAKALSEVGFYATKKFDWRPIPGAESLTSDWWYYGIEAIK